METLKIGQTTLTWLDGGVTYLDGGAMFGVVPKPLWSKKYPVNELNQIELRTDPILVQKEGINLLIDSGIGSGRLTDKQKRNFGVTAESNVIASLNELGLKAEDIDYVLMTHLHFDHVSGLTKLENDELVSVFPHAKIITSTIEWNEMREPNIRSANTYWKDNWLAIEKQVVPFEGKTEPVPGIEMIHTGGHSDGHSIVKIQDNGDMILHMADLMPTHAHSNPLWVLAYDDYPMNSIQQKQKWLEFASEKQTWLSFYHDAYYRAIKFNEKKEIIDKVERNRPE
ncbi:YtnP family quorum-quenching lactonase [Metabacillus hrfriensis]|uniref:MBL fold metallo-hydrolase n=1 Tax=Metabacillus hrfriensis TaxID=3048891 RepID=A0ACD4R8V1_9BACI|nr:MBL fold metallo-hydrolase [Metabacillus sp. CT-WN-B3]WHZ56876.1 MBL fold metallo-hydrolase [Metabacillus sp. CT-WN-B3]